MISLLTCEVEHFPHAGHWVDFHIASSPMIKTRSWMLGGKGFQYKVEPEYRKWRISYIYPPDEQSLLLITEDWFPGNTGFTENLD